MVLCSGCFDGLHAGHIAYFVHAITKAHVGEDVCVAVAPDAYIRRVKGREPYWPSNDRCVTVSAVRGVGEVIVHGDEGVADVIREYRPRLFVKGTDWDGHLEPDVLAACQEAKTSLYFVPEYPTRHTHDVSALLPR